MILLLHRWKNWNFLGFLLTLRTLNQCESAFMSNVPSITCTSTALFQGALTLLTCPSDKSNEESYAVLVEWYCRRKPTYLGKNYSIVTLTTTDLAWTGLKSDSQFHGEWLRWIFIIHKCHFVPYREHSGNPLQRPTGECYICKKITVNYGPHTQVEYHSRCSN